MRPGGRRTAVSPRRALALFPLSLILLLAVSCGGSWIRVQNISNVTACVTLTYYDENGAAVATDTRQLPPGGATNFPQSDNGNLRAGYRGSAMIDSDQPIVALRRTDRKGNTSSMLDGETLSVATKGGTLYLPLLMNQGGPFSAWNSRFNLQNLSDNAACVTITYVTPNTGAIAAVDPSSPQPGCPDGGRPLAARATLIRESNAYGVSGGFAGAARIDAVVSKSAPAGSQPSISATVDVWSDNFNLLSSYHALNSSELGTSVLLPLIEREVGPQSSYSTYFQIESTTPSIDVPVQLHFEGTDGNGAPVSRDASVTVKGAKLCVQASDDASNCLSGPGLPRGFSGWARLTSSTPIGVIVDRGSYFYDFGNYRGVPQGQAGTTIALPAVKRSSWLRVLAPGGANVQVRYVGSQLAGGEQRSGWSVNGLSTIFVGGEPLPDNFDGSAIITSDRPIAVVAAYDAGGGQDPVILYDGVSAR